MELDILIDDMTLYQMRYMIHGKTLLNTDLAEKMYNLRTERGYTFYRPQTGITGLPNISVLLEDKQEGQLVYIGPQGRDVAIGHRYYILGFDSVKEVEITDYVLMESFKSYPASNDSMSYYTNQQKYRLDYKVINPQVSLDEFRLVCNYATELEIVETIARQYNPNFPDKPPELDWSDFNEEDW